MMEALRINICSWTNRYIQQSFPKEGREFLLYETEVK